MYNYYLRRLLFCLIGLMPFTPFAQTDSTVVDSEYDVSLEDLLDMKVTVASKKEEKISDAAGSITAYSSQDMERLGYYTLRDLANVTAGYSAFSSIGETTFETRGQMQSGFDNNKHLVLIDGIPFNHARANMAPAEENMMLFFAKRVEFLKGPGSALYGTSAFSGVINIISKDMDQNGTSSESKMSIGNLDFKKRAMMNIVHKSDEGLTRLSVAYFGKDATRDYLGNGNYNNANSVLLDNSSNIFINASHRITNGVLKGLGAGLIYSRRTGGLGEFWMFHQNQTFDANQLTWEQIVPYLRYERKLADKLTLNTYLKGNMSTENAYTGGYQQTFNPAYGTLILTNYNIRVYDKEFFGELRYALRNNINIIGGANIISRHSTGAPETYSNYGYAAQGTTFQPDTTFYKRSSTYNIYSMFAQYQHTLPVLKGLILTAGTRWDIGRTFAASDGETTNKYQQLSPRIALVQKLTNQLNLKVMYGAALRAPLIKEVGLNEESRANALANPAVRDNVGVIKDIGPERITSLEGAITYNTNQVSLSGTAFYNETKNPLGAITSTELANARIYTNLPGIITGRGLEFEGQVAPTKNFKLGANFSTARAYSYSTNTEDTTYAANVPVNKFNAMFTYSTYAPVKISATLVARVINKYRSGTVHGFMKTVPNDPNDPTSTPKDDSFMKGFNVFDLNIVGQLTKNVGLELQVKNILDSEIRTPTGIVNSGTLNVPFPGRSFLGTVSFKF